MHVKAIVLVLLIFASTQSTTRPSTPSHNAPRRLLVQPRRPLPERRLEGETDNLITAQNAYEGYNADSTMDQINRNLRDDLLDKIESMVKRLEDKVTNLEGSFGSKMGQIQQSISGKLNKLVEKIHLQTAALKGYSNV